MKNEAEILKELERFKDVPPYHKCMTMEEAFNRGYNNALEWVIQKVRL